MIDFQALAAGHLEPSRVETELVQDRGVQVGDVVPMFDGVEAELVGRAVDDAALDAAAGEPGGEAVGVVVAAVRLLRSGRSAELGAPDDERLVQQAALFQIRQQSGDRLVDLGAEFRVTCLERRVGVPAPAPPLEPWKTCTKRTPFSTSRRAVRHSSPNGRVVALSRP